MDTNQKLKLRAEASKYSKTCHICYRHTYPDEFSNINSYNLLRHLIAAHGYKPEKPKRWWEFWK